MKTLRKVDIDSMVKDLPVLDKQERRAIVGGYSDDTFSCVFNCMEYIGSQHGLTSSDIYYSSMYTSITGHDPSESNGMYTSSIGSLLSQAGFGSTELERINNNQINGNQFILIPGGYGNDHAVVITSVSGGMVNYYDPTKGTTGSVSGSEVRGIYDTSPFIDYDSPGYIRQICIRIQARTRMLNTSRWI